MELFGLLPSDRYRSKRGSHLRRTRGASYPNCVPNLQLPPKEEAILAQSLLFEMSLFVSGSLNSFFALAYTTTFTIFPSL